MASTAMTLTGAGVGGSVATLLCKWMGLKYGITFNEGEVAAMASVSAAFFGTFKEILDWTCSLCKWCVELKRRANASQTTPQVQSGQPA